MKRILFFFTLLLARSFTPADASGEFFTQYNVTAEVTNERSFKIAQEVTLTNKLSNVYATEYSFKIEKTRPQNVYAFSEKGPLEVNVQIEDETTEIKLKFNEQIVGKDKTSKFTLVYESPELLRHSGQVWEVSLPKISSEEIDEYQLSLKVPVSFGKPAYISPSPQSQKTEETNQIFLFKKEQIASSAVVAVFGEFQIFNFVLTYHLANPADGEVFTKIALPPDTSYQKLAYENISPRPENLEIDSEGNWLAIYKLKSREKIDVLAYGQVKILASPQTKITGAQSREESLDRYLEGAKFWETKNPQIQAEAQKLKTPKEIFNFVVKTLDYDYSRVREGVKRLGAAEILKQPDRAICMEYTDLFIALARAAGIPAREHNGFAYTSNPLLQPLSLVQDVLHAWPEYWDSQKKVWVQVDPTWQDTTGGVDYFSKFDLGHFTFVIHGQDSEKPFSAGSYKDSQADKKDIEVSFGEYQEPSSAKAQVEFLFPGQILAERPAEGKIRVFNKGREAIYGLQINLQTENLKLLSDQSQLLTVLLPFSYQDIPVKLTTLQSFDKGQGKLIVLGNGQQFEHNIGYDSLVLSKLLPIFTGLLGIIILIYFTRRARRFLKKKREENEASRPTTENTG